jgi:hypothetical protein
LFESGRSGSSWWGQAEITVRLFPPQRRAAAGSAVHPVCEQRKRDRMLFNGNLLGKKARTTLDHRIRLPSNQGWFGSCMSGFGSVNARNCNS